VIKNEKGYHRGGRPPGPGLKRNGKAGVLSRETSHNHLLLSYQRERKLVAHFDQEMGGCKGGTSPISKWENKTRAKAGQEFRGISNKKRREIEPYTTGCQEFKGRCFSYERRMGIGKMV